jgi:hypothetical protein
MGGPTSTGVGGPIGAKIIGVGGAIGAKIIGSKFAGTNDGDSTVDTNMSPVASASTAPRIASRTCLPMGVYVCLGY